MRFFLPVLFIAVGVAILGALAQAGQSPRIASAGDPLPGSTDQYADLSISYNAFGTQVYSFWANTGTGAIAPNYSDDPPWTTTNVQLVWGDYNDDSVQDVAAIAQTGDKITIWIKYFSLFQAPSAWTVACDASSGCTEVWDLSATNFMSGDFSGDGVDDLAAAVHSGVYWTIYAFSNNGPGHFSPENILFANTQLPTDPGRVVAGDFNGDGIRDVAFLDGNGNHDLKITYYYNVGAPSYQFSYYDAYTCTACFNLAASKVVTGFFSNDGSTDLVMMEDIGPGTMTMWMFYNNGVSTQMDVHDAYTSDCQDCYWDMFKTRLVAGDFSGDGISDLAAMYDYGGGNMRIWFFYNQGPGSLDPHIAFDDSSGNYWVINARVSDEAEGPNTFSSEPTPTPSPTPVPTSPGQTPSPTPTPTPTPSPTPAPTSVGQTLSPTPPVTITPTPTPSATPVPTPSPTLPAQLIQGDVTCNGQATLEDAGALLAWLATNDGTPSGCLSTAAAPAAVFPFGDVNCDGLVDVLDVLNILRHIAALSEINLPPSCAEIGQPINA